MTSCDFLQMHVPLLLPQGSAPRWDSLQPYDFPQLPGSDHRSSGNGSSYQGKELAESFININDKYILITRLDNFDKKSLTSTFDYLKTLHENYIILLADVFENKISYIAGVSSSLNKEIPAGQLIKKIASLTNGSGGGRNDVAQGGGKDISSLNNALELIKGELIK